MAFPGDWQRRAALTVDHTQVAGSLSDFPVVLTADTLPDEMLDADGSAPAQGDGGDIQFTSDKDGANLLALDVVSWTPTNDPANAEAQLWVKVPSLSSAVDTDLYVWWGNAQATQPAPADTYGRNAVWTRFGTRLNGENLEDRTGRLGTLTNAGLTLDAAGPLGGAYEGDGTVGASTPIPAGSKTDLEGKTGATYGAWVLWDGNGSGDYQTVLNLSADANVMIRKTNNDKFSTFLRTDSGSDQQNSAISITPNIWYRAVWVYDDGEVRFYLDGSLEETDIQSGAIKATPDFELGYWSAIGQNWQGQFDEVFVTDEVFSDAWIATEYANQNDPTIFWIVGSPEVTAVELNPDSAAHAHEVAPSAFAQAHDFKTDAIVHGHVVGVTAFDQIHHLDTGAAFHQHTSALASFLQKHDLILADAAHVHVANQANVGTPPDLTITKVNVLTGTEAEIGVSTDTDSGKVYWVVTRSDTAPTVDQIKAGEDENGNTADAAGMKAV